MEYTACFTIALLPPAEMVCARLRMIELLPLVRLPPISPAHKPIVFRFFKPPLESDVPFTFFRR